MKYEQIFMPILNTITILKTVISEFSASDAVKEVAFSRYLFTTALNKRHL